MPRVPPVDLKPWFLAMSEIEGFIDWQEFFGNDNPVEIDVGCGRGMFLFNAGTANPDVNYLGIEIEFKEARRGARRLQKRELPNVRVLGGDAHFLFETRVRPASVAAVHVYFPDPWWKRRHRRRRVFTDELVNQMAQSLVPGGLVHSWTDVEEYFGVICSLMDHDARFERLPDPLEREPEHHLDYQTSFERKKRKAGFPIWRGLWRLRSSER